MTADVPDVRSFRLALPSYGRPHGSPSAAGLRRVPLDRPVPDAPSETSGPSGAGGSVLRFDIRLQGDHEMIFFDV